MGNTKNLFYHLQGNHPEEYSEVAPKKAIESTKKEKHESARQATTSGCFSAQQAYAHHTLALNNVRMHLWSSCAIIFNQSV